MEIDIYDIDFDRLRNDLKNYFGTAMYYFPMAMMDLIDIDTCSDMELLDLINKTPYDIADYINNKFIK